MTAAAFLADNTRLLQRAGISTARLDCLVLLEDVLNTNRTHLLAYPDTPLTGPQQDALNRLIQRRSRHEPLAYIRHKVEFYGRTFYVDRHVLVPRPESEGIIDMLKELSLPANAAIADIGTGSGALAVTAAMEMPDATVVGTDIDPRCLEVAARNASAYKAAVSFLPGDLAAPFVGAMNLPAVLLCNLPYVPEGYPVNEAAAHEPRAALFGGKDGLDLYRRLFAQVRPVRQGAAFLFAESLPAQHDALAAIARDSGFSLHAAQGYVQLFTRL